jgi:lysophospholipase L1-like esterase
LNPVVNTDVAPHHSMDGLWNQYDGTSAFPNLAEITPVNRSITLQYLRGPGRGSFSITTQSGQTIASLTSNVSDTDIGNFQLVLPPGDTEYHILPHRNGPLTFLGQNNVSGQQGVRIHRAANGGWGVENFLQRDFTFDLQTQSIGPEMVMVWLGQNDQSYNRQTYAVALNQLVDRIQTQAPAAEIVLVGTYDQGSPLLAPLVEAMADVAGNRNLGFLNLFRAAGDAAFFAENGYLDDGIHFSPAGGQYVADLMYNAFLTDGRSLKHREFATAESSLLIKQQEFLSRGSVPEPSAGLIIAGLTRFLFARGKKLSRN